MNILTLTLILLLMQPKRTEITESTQYDDCYYAAGGGPPDTAGRVRGMEAQQVQQSLVLLLISFGIDFNCIYLTCVSGFESCKFQVK